MSILFPDVLNAQRGAVAQSTNYVANAVGKLRIASTLPVSVANIVKNGANVGSSADYVPGDVLALRVQASAEASSPTQVVLELGDDRREDVWVAVTAADKALYLDPKMIGRSDVESFINADGATYFPQASANRLRVLPDIGQPSITSSSLARAVESAVGVTTNMVPVCSFHDHRVHLCDPSNGQVLRTITTPGTPYSAAFVPRNPNSPTVYDLWVTQTDRDSVVVYDANGVLIEERPVGDEPYQLAVSPNGQRVYVACASSDRLERFEYDGLEFKALVPIPTDGRPIHVVANNSSAFVACAYGYRVHEVSTSGAVTNVQVGQSPQGLALVGTALYVAVLTEAVVKKVVDGQITALIAVDPAPTSVTAINGGVAVICNSSASVLKIVDDAVVARSEFGEWPYSVHARSGRVFVAEQWQGAPNSFMYQLDREPYPFTLDSPQLMKRGSQYTTNEFVVGGLNAAVNANVSPLHGATIVRNDLAVGNSTQVVNGDRLRVRFATQTEPDERVIARLFVGASSADFETLTNPLDTRPDDFEFTPVFNAELAQTFTSNEITLTGLEDGLTVPLTLDRGRLILNGVQQSGLTAEVANGDRIQLSAESSLNESTPLFSKLVVGDYEAVWTIFTKYVEIPTNYMEQQYSGRTMFQLIDFGNVEQYVDRTKDKIQRFNKTTFAKIAEFPITPNGNQGPGSLTDNPLMCAFDPTRKAVDLIDMVNGSINTTQTYPAIPYAVSAAPMVAMGKIPTDQWVTVLGRNTIWQFNGSKTLPIQAGAEPMGIGCSNYNQLFVAGSSGFLYMYEYNDTTKQFTFDSIIGVPGGGRLQDILFDDTQMFVNDISNNLIHVLRSGLYIRSIQTGLMPYCIAQSGTMVYSANYGEASITAAPKDPAFGQPVTVSLPAGASLPNCMAYDATNGYLYVGSSVAGKVYVLRATTLAVVRIIDVGPVFGLQIVGDELVVLNRWGDLFTKLNIGLARTGPNNLVFGTTIVSDVNMQATTGNRQITTRMPRRETLWVEPYTDVELLHNGAGVDHQTTVFSGESIEVKAVSSSQYLKQRRVRAFSFNHATEFVIETPPDTFPDFVTFATQQHVTLNQRVTSEAKTVSGLGAGVKVRAMPKYSHGDVWRTEFSLFINGKLYVEGATESAEQTGSDLVGNGDTVQLAFNVIGVSLNGNRGFMRLYNESNYLWAEFQIITSYLDNAIKPPYKDDSTKAMDAIEDTKEDTHEVNVNRDVDEVMHLHVEAFDGPNAEFNHVTTADVDTEAEYAPDTARAETHIDRDAYVSSRTTAERPEMEYVRAETYWPHVIYNVLEWVGHTRSWCAADLEVTEAEFGQPFTWKLAESDGWQKRERARIGVRTQQHEVKDRSVVFSGTKEWVNASKRWTEFKTDWLRATRSIASVLTESMVGSRFVYEVRTEFRSGNRLNVIQFNSGSQGRDNRSRYEQGTTFRDHAHRSRYNVGTSGIVATRSTVSRSQSNGWWVTIDTSFYTASVQYMGRVRTKAMTVGTSGVAAYHAKPSLAGTTFVKRNRVHYDQFVYSAQGIRAFDSPAGAIAAGQAQQHPVVYAHKLYDSFFMWHIPALVERVDCARTALQARYVKGYVQGG